MRTMFRNFGFCCLAALSIGTSYASAQSGFTTGATGRAGNNLQLFNGGRSLPLPGRIWAQANIGDGLGYEGSYFTLGGKTHLADDFLDGRWLLETQGHVSENGGFFSNVGLERVFSLKKHGADLTLGGWIDYDGDENSNFGHSYWQGAVNASVRTQRWDVIANGYLPFGDDLVNTQGSLNGPSFFQNRITLVAGLDTALQGFDVTFRARPLQFANYNGSVDLGVYGYESDAVPYFTGVRARSGLQLANGWQINGEINRDDLFEWTGVLQLAYVWGANDRGVYAGLGNDLDSTQRNDHIVRFQRDALFAIDPDTGAPYNVLHVDNTATAGSTTGSFESRFTSLAQAEAVSNPDDIIYVYEGDGTTTGYDTGITLKDRQFLLGEGVAHLIPLSPTGSVLLPGRVGGDRPTLTNTAGNAITIAGDDTVIRGFEIDGAGGFMTHGIFANGLLDPVNNFRIEDVDVRNATLDGIHLENATGDLNAVRILAENNGRDGIALINYGDNDADIVLRDVTTQNNGRDGVFFNGYDAATVSFQQDFVSNGNLRHGVNLENFVNSAGIGASFFFDAPAMSGNVGDGLRINNADGNYLFQDSQLIGNGGNGLALINARNTNPLHQTLITTTAGNTSIFAGNAAAGVLVDLNDPGSVQRVLLELSTLTGNNSGLISRASGIGTNLTTDVINNLGITANLKDGATFRSVSGALHNVTVTNTLIGLGRLNMDNNGLASGNGINLFAGDLFSPDAATLNASISNVSLANIGTAASDSGIFAVTGNQGLLNATIDDVLITNAGESLTFEMGSTNPGLISRVRVTNSVVTNSRSFGMVVNNNGNSGADFLVNNVDFLNAGAAQAGESGVLFSNTGLMRVSFTNNTIDNFDSFGFVSQTGGAGRSLINFVANTVTTNGSLDIINGLGDLPNEDGVRFLTTGAATANVRFTNNIVQDNAQQGLNLTTTGGSELNILMDGNVIAANDQGGPLPPGPPVDAFIFDMLATNGIGSTMCVSMSSNTFVFPATLINNSGTPAGILELDGLTNGIGFPTAINFTPQLFGSTCEPAITAEEAAFAAAGF